MHACNPATFSTMMVRLLHHGLQTFSGFAQASVACDRSHFPEELILSSTVRYFLKQHLLRSTAAMAAACTAVHLAKQGLKRGTRGVKYIGPAVAFASDVALPTSLLGGLIVARFML